MVLLTVGPTFDQAKKIKQKRDPMNELKVKVEVPFAQSS